MLRLIAEALTKVGGRGHPFYCGAYTFAVVFRRTSAQAASHHLDVVRHVVERSTLDVRVPQRPPAGQPGRAGTVERTGAATISIRVAQPQGRRADPHEVLRAADLALDRAKQGGQNPVSAKRATERRVARSSLARAAAGEASDRDSHRAWRGS